MKESNVLRGLYFCEVENELGLVQQITLGISFTLSCLLTTKQFQFSMRLL